MKTTIEVTLSAKNRIVIPREASEALGLKSGDRLIMVLRGERLIVFQKPKAPHTAIRGLGRGLYSGAYLARERRSWD
jgi:AbrB family looped-hinge helix DNA binding protein